MNHPPAFGYILRYLIDPAFHAQDRMNELVDFCRQSRIEEVMLFLSAEELNTGHPIHAELEAYVEMGRQLRSQLDEAGIDLSLNPWTTLHHGGRGRTLRDSQAFACMVGETGVRSEITACPLCPHWQEYLCESFAFLVREIEPVAIWVEDDWRLHNHGANMNWGGCFCDLHLARFGKMVGQCVTREQVLASVLAPGQPHPWRAKWLELSRDSLLEPARRLRHAVEQASPRTRIGLMSSAPDVHSTEGRNWHVLQNALGNRPAFLTRPHMPPYTETNALSTTPAVTRLTIANLQRPLEVYPELENSPRNGPYAKSSAYSIWQCFQAATFGSHGITINHYDMMGNGIALDSQFGQTLAQHKDRLDALVQLGIDDQQAQGLGVLFSPQVAQSIHCANRASLHGLTNPSDIWSQTAFILGMAHGFTARIPHERSEPLAVGGQTLRAFDDDDIGRLLSGPVILDAISVDVLMQRGFGAWLGVDTASWCTSEQDDYRGYAYESIHEPDATVYGLANPRMTAQRCARRLLAMQVNNPSDMRTHIRRADHETLMPGLVMHKNAHGGSIAMLAYPFDGQAQFFMGFFNVFRRKLMHDLLFEIAPQAHLAVCDSHPMHVYRTLTAHGLLLGLFNPLHDPAEQPVLRMPAGQVNPDMLRSLDDKGSWHAITIHRDPNRNDDYLKIPLTIAPLESCFLIASSD